MCKSSVWQQFRSGEENLLAQASYTVRGVVWPNLKVVCDILEMYIINSKVTIEKNS